MPAARMSPATPAVIPPSLGPVSGRPGPGCRVLGMPAENVGDVGAEVGVVGCAEPVVVVAAGAAQFAGVTVLLSSVTAALRARSRP